MKALFNSHHPTRLPHHPEHHEQHQPTPTTISKAILSSLPQSIIPSHSHIQNNSTISAPLSSSPAPPHRMNHSPTLPNKSLRRSRAHQARRPTRPDQGGGGQPHVPPLPLTHAPPTHPPTNHPKKLLSPNPTYADNVGIMHFHQCLPVEVELMASTWVWRAIRRFSSFVCPEETEMAGSVVYYCRALPLSYRGGKGRSGKGVYEAGLWGKGGFVCLCEGGVRGWCRASWGLNCCCCCYWCAW
ncbi:hypothetical protein BKA81DRAFT_105426 [Phyllosticta paracitricarpa]